MSRDFIEKLEQIWKQNRNRPPSDVVDWLARSTVNASESDIQFIRDHVDPHQPDIEKALLKIYTQEGKPEQEWLAILRRPGPLDLSDTSALSVIARWYNVDPDDQLTQMNLLAGIPMAMRSRPSEAGLNTPRIMIGRAITILVALIMLLLCLLILRSFVH